MWMHLYYGTTYFYNCIKSQFCGLDHRTCISFDILTSHTHYGAKKKNTVKSSCLPHGLTSKACGAAYGPFSQMQPLPNLSGPWHITQPTFSNNTALVIQRWQWSSLSVPLNQLVALIYYDHVIYSGYLHAHTAGWQTCTGRGTSKQEIYFKIVALKS